MSSEKTLIVVAVIAVIVSAVAMFVSIFNMSNVNDWVLGLSPGGSANQSVGVVNVTIVQNLVINFSSDQIIWGRGAVDAGKSFAILDSASNVIAINGTWNRSNSNSGTTPGEGDGKTTPSGFVLNNIGNIKANLYLRTDLNATTFLVGGTSPSYQYNVTNSGGIGCPVGNQTGSTYGSYVDVNITSPGTKVCNMFEFVSPNNALRIDIKLVIPNDVTTSNVARTSRMFATAELA